MADLQLDIDIKAALQDLAQFKAELKDSRTELNQLQKANKAAFDRGTVDGVVDAINELQSEYKQLQAASSTLKSALKNATDPEAVKLYADALAKAEKGMLELEQAGKKAGVAVKATSNELGTGRQVAENFFGAFGKVAIITAAIAAVVKFGKSALDLANQTEKATKQFEALTGSAEKARGIIADLQGFASRTFLPVASVNEAGKALIAFGENTNNLIPVLDRVANISAATGKDFNELVTIYGKARAAGVLYAEDINQLVDAGIPIIKQFSEQMGVSADQVKKLASEGKIGFGELELAFAKLTQNGGLYADQLGAQAETLTGRWNKYISLFNEKITAPVGNFLKTAALGFLDVSEAIEKARVKTLQFLGLLSKTNEQKAKEADPTIAQREAVQAREDALYDTLALEEKVQKEREKLQQKSNAAAAAKAADLRKKQAKEAEDFEREKTRLAIDIMAEGIEKELAQTNYKYDELVNAAKKYGLDTEGLEQQRLAAIADVLIKSTETEVAIIEDGNKAKLKALDDQKGAIEQEKALRLQQIDIAEAQSDAFLLRLKAGGAEEKEIALAKEEFDKQTQAARLRTEIDFQEKLLAITDAGDAARIEQIKNSIALLKAELGNVEFDGGTAKVGFLEKIQTQLGLSDDDMDQIKQAGQVVIDTLNQITEARVQEAEAAVQAAETKVSAAQDALDRELQIAELGFSNNVDLRRKDLLDAEAGRQKALKDRQKALKAQLAADTAQQASGMITSAVNIIQGYSGIPIVGIALGIAAVAAMIGFIASVRARAKAINSQQFREGGQGRVGEDGVIVGPSHQRGGVVVPEYEGGEFFTSDGNRFAVVNKRMTEKHFDLLQAVNRDDRGGMAAALEKITGGPAVNRDGIRARMSGESGGTMVHISKGDGFTPRERKELMGLLKTWKAQSGKSRQQIGEYLVETDGNQTRRIKNG